MKVSYEYIKPDPGSSFKVISWKSENDEFFWHQHPEHEIILIVSGQGNRQIGNNKETYSAGQVYFLGPNLPHTGFGHGQNSEHEEIIIQLSKEFLGQGFLAAPELVEIRALFTKSAFGLLFSKESSAKMAPIIKKLPNLRPFDRLLQLLQLFKIMAFNSTYRVLNTPDNEFLLSKPMEAKLHKIFTYVEKNYHKEIAVKELSGEVGLTVPSFCRYFKKVTRLTFTDFLNDYRINQVCKFLLMGKSVSEACYASGYNNISYFNKTFKKLRGKSPREWIKEVEPKDQL